MKQIAWVAHASRVLATVFESPAVASHPLRHRRELFESANPFRTASQSGKFVAVEHRDQHTRRVRYPAFFP
jgi:hypothetical protein